MGEDNGKSLFGPPKEGARELAGHEKVIGPDDQQTSLTKTLGALGRIITGPADWIYSVVGKTRGEDYPWYHRRYRRVPTIDECYVHDDACRFEAAIQMNRDKQVEEEIVAVLRSRATECLYYEGYRGELVYTAEEDNKCKIMHQEWERAAANLFIKYGELSYGTTPEEVLLKQKHRLIWERRHGPLPTERINLDKISGTSY